MRVDVKRRQWIVFLIVELIFLLVEEKVIKVNGYFPQWNKLLLMWMKIFRR